MVATLNHHWPGTELNRRRQPFQSVVIQHVQQLAGLGRLRKYLEVRASRLWVAEYALRDLGDMSAINNDPNDESCRGCGMGYSR